MLVFVFIFNSMVSDLSHFVRHLLGLSFLKLGNASEGLASHDTASPVTTDLFESLVEVGLDCFCQLAHGSTILRIGSGESKASGSLTAHNTPKTSLVLDNAVWDSQLSAQSRQEEDNLQRINIMGNDDQGSLLLLNKGGDGVHTGANAVGALGRSVLLTLSTLLSTHLQAGFLLLLGLRPVFVQKTEQLGGCLSVKGLVDLVDWRGFLQALEENSLLALKTDVLGPCHKTAQVTLGLDILADSEVLWALLEEGVDHLLGLNFASHQRGCGYLLLTLLRLRHVD